MTATQVGRLRSGLERFVEAFAVQFGRSERRHWCGRYLEGLLLDGDRKSVEPMAARVEGGDEQALQQFLNQSPWPHEAVMERLREWMFTRAKAEDAVLVLDDTSLPKQGRHSVGVARQYCGALGKISNCQSIVSWHWASKTTHWPLAARLYLPKQWTGDQGRMERAGVPSKARTFREKWRLALELLDAMKTQLPVYGAIVFDAGYGVVLPLLAELEARGEHYVAQIPGNVAAWPANVRAVPGKPGANGRPRLHARVEDPKLKPKTAARWREELQADPKAWRTVTLPVAGSRTVRVAAVRVRGTQRKSRVRQPGPERWLLIEDLPSGESKYHLSNLPADTPIEEMIRLAHQRWKIEQGYQQLKEELGLDHFEGRSWTGLHHHLALFFMAYAFLTDLRQRTSKKTPHSSRGAPVDERSHRAPPLPRV